MAAVTREIVVQFAEEQSWTARAKTIERVATGYVEEALAPDERLAALVLFRLALGDGEALVRRILAESLKHARELPKDIVQALVQERPEVSAPFLAASPLLDEDTLAAIAKAGTCAQRAAIAGRPDLSDRVAALLFGRRAVA